MARPRRTTEQEWFDIFADWDLAEQERTITFLQELHRQAKRQAGKRFAEPAKEAETVTITRADLIEGLEQE